MSFPIANFSHFQMPIANCQFPIADFSLFPLLSESTELAKIGNWQSLIGNAFGNRQGFHSLRNAISGSSFVALRAGI